MPDTRLDHYDEEDVPVVLANTETSDGSGFKDESELPESDFVSFSEAGVEDDEEIDQ